MRGRCTAHWTCFYLKGYLKSCTDMKGRTKIAACITMVGIACLVVGVLTLNGVIFAFSPSTCLITPNATASCVERGILSRTGRFSVWYPRLTNVRTKRGSACPLLFYGREGLAFLNESACWDAWVGCRGHPGQCDIFQYDASLDQVTCYGPEELIGGPSCTLTRKPMEDWFFDVSPRYRTGMVLVFLASFPTGIAGFFLLLCVLPSACEDA